MPPEDTCSEDLNQRILVAHAAGRPRELAKLYAAAADLAESDKDIGRTCFFLTFAWIFALESGADTSDWLKSRLVAHGRDI